MATATFAMGCFWGPEATFRGVTGVTDVTVGYTGGHTDNPSYEQVCRGDTGHAEAVRIEFDPAVVGYEALLDVFWANHDPTTKDRQGPDIGRQYRSAIFTHDDDQLAAARDSLEGKQAGLSAPIVTAIEPAPVFYPAEAYHQRYLEKHGAVC